MRLFGAALLAAGVPLKCCANERERAGYEHAVGRALRSRRASAVSEAVARDGSTTPCSPWNNHVRNVREGDALLVNGMARCTMAEYFFERRVGRRLPGRK